MSKMRVFAMAIALAALGGCGGGGSGGGMSGTPSPATATTTTGTITGFGSVVINGTHYNTSSATFVADDAPATQADLSAGEEVTISGSTDAQGNHEAHEVEYDSQVVGPISAINATGNSFTALGQTVNVDVTTVYDGVANFVALAVGNNVAVSGPRDASGNIAATFVRLLTTAPASVRLRGAVTALNSTATTFTIGAETINYATATIVPTGTTLQNGQPVVVSGTLDSTGTIITAAKVRIRKDLDGANPGEDGELEGLVTQAAMNNSFKVGMVAVNYDANTVFVNGTATDLIVGARVEVHGTLNTDGSIQATKIEVEMAEHAGNSRGFLLGALSAAPNTTTTPNTISLLGQTVTVTSNTILSDHEQHDPMFKLSDLMAGDRVLVAVLLTPAATAGGTPTLTALKIERPDSHLTLSGASGVFSNVSATATTLSVETISVTGQPDCASQGGSSSSSSGSSSSSSSGSSGSSSSSSSSGAGSSSSGGGNSACTRYFVQDHPSTGAAFFQALGNSANANDKVLALGTFAGGTLTAQGLDLRSDNESGDDPH